MIDLGWLGQIEFTWGFVSAVMSIVLIDLVLAGDNAVVIAMAVKNLPGRQRTWGITLGAGGAVIIRVICTFLVAQLLVMPYVKFIGGAVILWIAVKLLTQGTEEHHAQQEAAGLWQALWIIVVADLSMGIDNMLAVGAASHGSLFLLLFGLGLSIPFVVLMSNMLSKLMDRYPTHPVDRRRDPRARRWGDDDHRSVDSSGSFSPPTWVAYAVEAFFIIFVCGLAKILIRRRAGGGLTVAPVVEREPAI